MLVNRRQGNNLHHPNSRCALRAKIVLECGIASPHVKLKLLSNKGLKPPCLGVATSEIDVNGVWQQIASWISSFWDGHQ